MFLYYSLVLLAINIQFNIIKYIDFLSTQLNNLLHNFLTIIRNRIKYSKILHFGVAIQGKCTGE